MSAFNIFRNRANMLQNMWVNPLRLSESMGAVASSHSILSIMFQHFGATLYAYVNSRTFPHRIKSQDTMEVHLGNAEGDNARNEQAMKAIADSSIFEL